MQRFCCTRNAPEVGASALPADVSGTFNTEGPTDFFAVAWEIIGKAFLKSPEDTEISRMRSALPLGLPMRYKRLESILRQASFHWKNIPPDGKTGGVAEVAANVFNLAES
jgi:hypothetical protein